MKLNRLTKIAMAAVAVLLVGWFAIGLFTATESKDSELTVIDPTRCPDCGRELPKHYVGSGQCPFCDAEGKSDSAKPKARRASARSRPIVPIALVTTFCLLVAIHLGLAIRTRIGANKDEASYYVVCGNCTCRLRYRKRQIGRLGVCPLCRKPLLFPTPEDYDESRWSRWRRWLKSRARSGSP